MNTLNYKALFKTGIFIFLKALGIYLVISLPSMVALPAMYIMSAGYALSFGWIAAVIFLPLFVVTMQMKQSESVKNSVMYSAVFLAVLIAFQMMEVLGAQDNIWHEPLFLLFPACAVAAGWISLAISRQRIRRLLSPVAVEYYLDMEAVENTLIKQKNV